MNKISSVDEYIESSNRREELALLRKLALDCGLSETVKWGSPVYTMNKKNILGIGAFKSYAGIWFFQGVFLKDELNKLINAQEGKTKALRQWRFSSLKEIKESKDLIKTYILEAMDNQAAGMEIKASRKKDLIIPVELDNAFKNDRKLLKAFNDFSDFKKREFSEYISEAKRSETRMKRLEKVKTLIIRGVGLNDKYR